MIDPNAIVGAPEPIFISDKLMPEGILRLDEAFSKRKGLTVRAHFAAMAMQGLMANSDMVSLLVANNQNSGKTEGPEAFWKHFAQDAVAAADVLISELNK